jgi:large subunit ribosomal protein L6
MSRVGKNPIPIPEKVKIEYKDRMLSIKGEKGSLSHTVHPEVELEIADNVLRVVVNSQKKSIRAFQGMTRALVANMVKGVSKGFERRLEINGIGYRAEVNGQNIILSLGYSHPIDFKLPKNVSATIEKNIIKLSCIDKQILGETAALLRRLRPPEPYKGKGIKYVEEHIQRKAGKTGAK